MKYRAPAQTIATSQYYIQQRKKQNVVTSMKYIKLMPRLFGHFQKQDFLKENFRESGDFYKFWSLCICVDKKWRQKWSICDTQ